MYISMFANSDFVSIPKELEGEERERYIKELSHTLEIYCIKHKETTLRAKVGYFSMFNAVKYTNCPICEKERFEEAKRKEQEEILRKKQAYLNLLLSCGVSKRYILNRENLKDTPLFERLKGKLNTSDNNNLILLGKCGVGKSFFAFALLEKYLKEKKGAVYFKASQILEKFKSKTLDSGFNRTNSFENIEFLIMGKELVIIDEIDDSFADLTAFNHIVSYCHDNCIRLVVIGNCDKAELKSAMLPKIYSRLQGGKGVYVFASLEDLRGKDEI